MVDPDPIQEGIVLLDESGAAHSLTLEDVYRYTASIKLRRSVPVHLRQHFQVARNLLIYSWFEFSFVMSAQLHAYITTEMALRLRLESPRVPLRRLLSEAVRRGLVAADGFPSLAGLATARITKAGPEVWDALGALMAAYADGEEEYASALVEVLVNAIPDLRNELAHGSTEMNDGGFQTVAVCCDLINQLFPEGWKAK